MRFQFAIIFSLLLIAASLTAKPRLELLECPKTGEIGSPLECRFRIVNESADTVQLAEELNGFHVTVTEAGHPLDTGNENPEPPELKESSSLLLVALVENVWHENIEWGGEDVSRLIQKVKIEPGKQIEIRLPLSPTALATGKNIIHFHLVGLGGRSDCAPVTVTIKDREKKGAAKG